LNPLLSSGGFYNYLAVLKSRSAMEEVIRKFDLFTVYDIPDTLMDRAIKGYPYCKAALDMALYDVVGKTLKVPAYDLLGGRCRERVTIAHSIGLMEIDKGVEEALQKLGIERYVAPLTSFKYAGGSVHCLTNEIY